METCILVIKEPEVHLSILFPFLLIFLGKNALFTFNLSHVFFHVDEIRIS